MTVEPDIAVIRLGVEVVDDTVSAAKDQAANSSNRVLRVIKNNAIPDKDIQTSRLSIQPRYEYKPTGRELIGYAVSWDITINVLDLEKVDFIIDNAITAGGEFITISSINFQAKDVKNAKSDAENTKVSIRNVRREGNSQLKEFLKEKEISEDEERQGEEEIQKLTDIYVNKVDEILSFKEKDLLDF